MLKYAHVLWKCAHALLKYSHALLKYAHALLRCSHTLLKYSHALLNRIMQSTLEKYDVKNQFDREIKEIQDNR